MYSRFKDVAMHFLFAFFCQCLLLLLFLNSALAGISTESMGYRESADLQFRRHIQAIDHQRISDTLPDSVFEEVQPQPEQPGFHWVYKFLLPGSLQFVVLASEGNSENPTGTKGKVIQGWASFHPGCRAYISPGHLLNEWLSFLPAKCDVILLPGVFTLRSSLLLKKEQRIIGKVSKALSEPEPRTELSFQLLIDDSLTLWPVQASAHSSQFYSNSLPVITIASDFSGEYLMILGDYSGVSNITLDAGDENLSLLAYRPTLLPDFRLIQVFVPGTSPQTPEREPSDPNENDPEQSETEGDKQPDENAKKGSGGRKDSQSTLRGNSFSAQGGSDDGSDEDGDKNGSSTTLLASLAEVSSIDQLLEELLKKLLQAEDPYELWIHLNWLYQWTEKHFGRASARELLRQLNSFMEIESLEEEYFTGVIPPKPSVLKEIFDQWPREDDVLAFMVKSTLKSIPWENRESLLTFLQGRDALGDGISDTEWIESYFFGDLPFIDALHLLVEFFNGKMFFISGIEHVLNELLFRHRYLGFDPDSLVKFTMFIHSPSLMRYENLLIAKTRGRLAEVLLNPKELKEFRQGVVDFARSVVLGNPSDRLKKGFRAEKADKKVFIEMLPENLVARLEAELSYMSQGTRPQTQKELKESGDSGYIDMASAGHSLHSSSSSLVSLLSGPSSFSTDEGVATGSDERETMSETYLSLDSSDYMNMSPQGQSPRSLRKSTRQRNSLLDTLFRGGSFRGSVRSLSSLGSDKDKKKPKKIKRRPLVSHKPHPLSSSSSAAEDTVQTSDSLLFSIYLNNPEFISEIGPILHAYFIKIMEASGMAENLDLELLMISAAPDDWLRAFLKYYDQLHDSNREGILQLLKQVLEKERYKQIIKIMHRYVQKKRKK